MASLTNTDLQFVVRRIPRDIRELLQQHRLFVAGGFIRETIAGGEVNDVDLFGTSGDQLHTIATMLAVQREANPPHVTNNAITLLSPPRLPVQFITRWCFDDPAKLVASFDFTVCQAAIWFENGTWRSSVSEGFYPDLAARRLVYTFPERQEEAGGSMMRVRKFLSRGYTIQADSLAGVIARIAAKVDWTKAGNEQRAATVIAGLLYEVDPMFVVDGLPADENAEV